MGRPRYPPLKIGLREKEKKIFSRENSPFRSFVVVFPLWCLVLLQEVRKMVKVVGRGGEYREGKMEGLFVGWDRGKWGGVM